MPAYIPLLCLALLHTLVDSSALLMAPLWGDLRESFSLTESGLFVLFMAQALSTSLSQAVFGFLRDRYSTRWILWAGPVVAAVLLSLIGVAPSATVLCVMVVVGGIGVGAFHPEAAVTAGRLIPTHRTRGLSLFMFGGALGLGLGPIVSGAVVSQFGLAGLAGLAPPLVLLVGLLVWAGRLGKTAAPAPPAGPPPGLLQMLQGRAPLAVFILLVCSLRLVPNMAMDKVLAFTLKGQGESPLVIGMVQSLFLFSASAGMFLLAVWFRPGWERRFMIWCPLLGIPLLYVLGMPDCPRWLLLATLVVAGIVLWGTTPVIVSYAHQQFPNGPGLASALTMGLSWGVGGMIQANITSAYADHQFPQQALHMFIPFVALSAVGAALLPASASRQAPHQPPARRAESADAEGLR